MEQLLIHDKKFLEDMEEAYPPKVISQHISKVSSKSISSNLSLISLSDPRAWLEPRVTLSDIIRNINNVQKCTIDCNRI